MPLHRRSRWPITAGWSVRRPSPIWPVAAAEPDLFARAAALRGELTAERARLVLEQVGLRQRGLKKFADAAATVFYPSRAGAGH